MAKKQHRVAQKASKPPTSKLRIIGGQWRSRQLPFIATEGLRPTPDRVRETLFNWLQIDIIGARCLDLFCGSGALGLEALSREAAEVTFVDNNRQNTQQLQVNCTTLDTSNSIIITGDAVSWLKSRPKTPSSPIDIVFLDPPFRADWVNQCCEALEESQHLSHNAWIYIEREAEAEEPDLPKTWRQKKQKITGQVCYTLYQRNASCEE